MRVGLVANPFSARDIRRVIANAASLQVTDRANIVLRVLACLGACGVSEVLAMPERGGIRAHVDRGLERARNTGGEEREMPEAPAGVPDSFSEHMRLMFDLQVLALQTGMTRVISFKTGRDADNRVFPESGSNRPFHPASHHGGRDESILEFNKICQYRVGQLPYFLDKLRDTMDGESSLLDQTMIMWGSPMADANLHNHRRCPLVLLGGANGLLEGNLHLRAPDGTPMANAMLTALNGLGMEMETFGDSTGEFALTGSAPASTEG